MKRMIFTVLLSAATMGVFAQNTLPDTTTTSTDKPHHKWLKYTRGDRGNGRFGWRGDSANTKPFKPHAYLGITFARFDLGLATLIDNGSFTLSPQNQFLRYRSWKTSNVGFDVFQFGYKFTPNFKIYVSGGFDWTLIRLRDNITILPNQPVLTYRQDNIDYSKNRFSSSYLRIPLSFDFQTNKDERGNRFHFVFGPDGGFLIDGMVKQISAQNGKQKIDDNYHFTTFRYGGFARVGYGDVGIFAKYYTNDMFENSPAQAGLKNFSFGITVGF
jgi:hypothetical protein